MRSNIDEWFGEFIKNHTIRNPRSDWPAAGSEEARIFFGPFRQAFDEAGVEPHLAKRASYDLAEKPPRGKSDHLPALLKRVEELKQADHDATYRPDPGPRDCRECSGTGWAIRYIHPELAARSRMPAGARVAIPCDCAEGAVMQQSRAVPGKPLPPRLADYPSFRDDRAGIYRERPVAADAASDAGSIRTPADLRAYCADLGAAKRVPLQQAATLTLDGAIPDPVVDRAGPPRPFRVQDIRVPEDDLNGWC